MDTEDARVGESVKLWRKLRSLSQTELAERMTEAGHPMQQQTILKIEKGTRPLRFIEAVALAQALDVDLKSLYKMTRDQMRLRQAEYLAREARRFARQAADRVMSLEHDHRLLLLELNELPEALRSELSDDFMTLANMTPAEILEVEVQAMRPIRAAKDAAWFEEHSDG